MTSATRPTSVVRSAKIQSARGGRDTCGTRTAKRERREAGLGMLTGIEAQRANWNRAREGNLA
ncbi:hypothetical protein GCM10007874_49430 [Labrys miyagiensis]|uniref:Uncharacterized protein n=1 Tax=Labrys miyagiensis TaxID=346912 RepID=A0ABQ6CNH7_9HYPH|nr:hypothetical protein GCM10007874_49430 [Labrys miyagiensis]